MNATILVPTYKRTLDLHRCLLAIEKQTRLADEVLVVVRDEDEATHHWMEYHSYRLPLRTVPVVTPGQVAALNAGLDAVCTEIVAITDDDAAPKPDWLARIVQHFMSDERIAGVGGRDWVHQHGGIEDGQRETVGKIQWFGRAIGNHHLGVGRPRPVDVLKGANMSYRIKAVGSLRFDERLRGKGSQIHNDLFFSLSLRRAGWILIYDPDVAVDHYPAQRLDEDKRDTFNAFAHTNIVHNETLALLESLTPPQRAAYVLWVMAMGTYGDPGLLQALRRIASGDKHALKRYAATVQGRVEGIRTFATCRSDQNIRPAIWGEAAC